MKSNEVRSGVIKTDSKQLARVISTVKVSAGGASYDIDIVLWRSEPAVKAAKEDRKNQPFGDHF